MYRSHISFLIGLASLVAGEPALASPAPSPASNVVSSPTQPAATSNLPIYVPRKPVITYTITGTIRISDCDLPPNAVQVRIDRTNVPVTADDQGLSGHYQLAGLAAGMHTVLAFSDALAVQCPNAQISPVQIANLGAGDDGGNHDFTVGVLRHSMTITSGEASVLGAVAFSGARLSLDTLDSIDGSRADFYDNHSFFQMNATASPIPLAIPDITFAWGTGNAHAYVNNIALTSTHLSIAGGKLRLTMTLAGDGQPELISYQQNAVFAPPSLDMRNMRVVVEFAPIRDAQRRVSYGDVTVAFEADIHSDANVIGALADAFDPSYTNQIRSTIETQFHDYLVQPSTREMITSLLASQLALQGVHAVDGLTVAPAQLTLSYE